MTSASAWSGASSSAATSAQTSGPAAMKPFSDGADRTSGPRRRCRARGRPSARRPAAPARRGEDPRHVTASPAPAGPRPARRTSRSRSRRSGRAVGRPRPERGRVALGEHRSQLRLVGAAVRARGGQEEVEEAVLALGAHRMVQPGRRLEGQPEVARRDEEGRDLLDRRHLCAAAAELRLRARGGDRGERVAPALLERDLAERLDVGEVLPRDARPSRPPRRGTALSRQSPPSSTTLSGGCASAERGLELAQPRGGADEAGEHPAVLGRPGARVLRHRRLHVQARGREQRRVVDQAR